MKIIPIIYTVRGTGPFPIDLLREDGSSPYSQQDSRRIEIAVTEPSVIRYTQVTLIKEIAMATWSKWCPNSAKWKSFGWTVISVEEKRA